MTTYLNNYKNPLYRTSYDDAYNGVVRVSNSQSYGTGALLYDGRSILTAAHIFEGYDTDTITVYFDTATGTQGYEATIQVYDGYDSTNSNGDLAILTLLENPDAFYERYEIASEAIEMGEEFTMVGYGAYGNGSTGEDLDATDILKLKTSNTFESDFYDIYTAAGTNLAWEPLADSILAADFDGAYSVNDAFGNILGLDDLGLGYEEGMIAAGDSGGPAFVDGKVVGVASYTAAISSYDVSTDVNYEVDSSFGEVGAWQSVSYYQEWIDKTIRDGYIDAPTTKEEVQTSVIESDDGISYAYFLLEFLGDRESVSDNITCTYTTRDGTATAGEDYIALSGTITLYSDESSAVLAVEVIGDTTIESDETFYMDVSNPSYGSFEDDAITISAVRTIVDDDFGVG